MIKQPARIIAAIDVGASGALVISDPALTSVIALPWCRRSWEEALRLSPPDLIAIEKVSGGTLTPSKAFAFGEVYGRQVGLVESAFPDLPIIHVSPAVWQAQWRDRLPRGDDAYAKRKNILHDIACEMFPQSRVYKYAADAFLILHWLQNRSQK